MELRHLKHFQAVAKHQSFGKAAKFLHLSQPALSRSIQAFERHLDVLLFDRHKKTISLTPFGNLVLNRTSSILQGTELLNLELAEMKGAKTGEIKIGASGIPADAFLGQAIGTLIKKHPKLRITVLIQHDTHLVSMLRNGEIDLFIGETDEISLEEDLVTFDLTSDRAVFLCRSTHPILAKSYIKIKDLKQYPIALPTSLPVNIKKEIALALGRRSHKGMPIEDIAYNNFSVAKSIIRHSDTISITPFLAIKRELDEGSLAAIPLIDMPAMKANFGIVTLANKTLSPAVDSFIETQIAIAKD